MQATKLLNTILEGYQNGTELNTFINAVRCQGTSFIVCVEKARENLLHSIEVARSIKAHAEKMSAKSSLPLSETQPFKQMVEKLIFK